MKNLIKFLEIALALTNSSCAYISSMSASVSPETLNYQDALEDAKGGKSDFGLVKFDNYLKEYPNSPHKQGIKFAIIEYYLQINDYQDAILNLKQYIEEYPKDKSTVFAKALAYKAISEYGLNRELIEPIKEGFFSKSLFLIFSESKTKSYTSILGNTYKIVDYIDKIQFLKNNELFLEVSP